MRKYPKYKDSGVEWIGDIPDGWILSKFKFDTTTPVQYGLNISSDKYKEQGIRFIRITDLTEEGLLIKENGKYLEKNEVPDDFLLKKYDVLFCRSGHTVGKSYLHLEDGEYTSGGYLVRFNFSSFSSSKFVFYLTKTNFYWDWIKLNTVISTIENVNGDKYQNFIYPKPPLQEQQQIVTYLDQKTSQIDTLVSLTENKIELLKEKRTSLINDSVTKGLDKTVKMKDSGVEWIGEIPSHWEITKLKYIGETIIGLSYTPEDIVDEGQGILVLRSSNIQNGKLCLEDNVYVRGDLRIKEKIITRKGDILICSRNGSRNLIGKNIVIDERVEGNTFGVFMTIFRSSNWSFLAKVFNSTLFLKQTDLYLTSTINQLTVDTLNGFLIPFPPILEQQQIVDYIDHHTKEIDKLISIEQRRIDTLKEYRQSLISEVVTGKVKVSNS
jgi:type I restriction enzyme S subunit